jgi:hypothetical protein
MRFSSFILLLLFGCFLGCGSAQSPEDQRYAALIAPATRAPSGPVEEAILLRLEELKPNQPTTIEGHQVRVGPVYSAASGRDCRRITIEGPTTQGSLACLMPEGWSFVPTVFADESIGT